MGSSLKFCSTKTNPKPAYLNRRIPSETKLSVKCNLYGSNVWYASKTIVRQMERLQRKSLKWIKSNSHFTDKEYNDCLQSVNLLPITYQFVFLDLLVLNRILTRKLPLEAEQFGQIRNGHPKTRSNEKKKLYTQTNVIASVADLIFSTELQTSTIRCRWCVIFPTITHIQVLPDSKQKSKNIFLILPRRVLVTNRTHMDGQCLRETKFKPR